MDRSKKFVTQPGEMQKLWPVDEVTELMQMTTREVYNLAQSLDIEFYHVDEKDRIIQSDLDRMMAACRFLMTADSVVVDEKLKQAAEKNRDICRKLKMDELDKKVQEYVDTFHENVPVFSLPRMSTAELIKLIDNHLQRGEPIVPDVPNDPSINY